MESTAWSFSDGNCSAGRAKCSSTNVILNVSLIGHFAAWSLLEKSRFCEETGVPGDPLEMQSSRLLKKTSPLIAAWKRAVDEIEEGMFSNTPID